MYFLIDTDVCCIFNTTFIDNHKNSITTMEVALHFHTLCLNLLLFELLLLLLIYSTAQYPDIMLHCAMELIGVCIHILYVQ